MACGVRVQYEKEIILRTGGIPWCMQYRHCFSYVCRCVPFCSCLLSTVGTLDLFLATNWAVVRWHCLRVGGGGAVLGFVSRLSEKTVRKPQDWASIDVESIDQSPAEGLQKSLLPLVGVVRVAYPKIWDQTSNPS